MSMFVHPERPIGERRVPGVDLRDLSSPTLREMRAQIDEILQRRDAAKALNDKGRVR